MPSSPAGLPWCCEPPRPATAVDVRSCRLCRCSRCAAADRADPLGLAADRFQDTGAGPGPVLPPPAPSVVGSLLRGRPPLAVGAGLGAGVAGAMDLIDRLVDRVVASSVPLREAPSQLGRLIPEEAPLAPPGTVQDVVDALVGLGPIERLLRQPEVTDVLVNGDGTVWVERRGELERATVRFAGSGAVVAAVERTLAPLGLQARSGIADGRRPSRRRQQTPCRHPAGRRWTGRWWRCAGSPPPSPT